MHPKNTSLPLGNDRKFVNITGRRFGRLTVQHRSGIGSWGAVTWQCVCDCGNTSIVQGKDLKSGNTQSCGCLRNDVAGGRTRTHGKSDTRAYKIWMGMLKRCNNENDCSYHCYGGRGIQVLFKSFEEFHAEVGDPPVGATIDRIDNNGHYAPGNVRWLSRADQMLNIRNNRYITARGKTQTLVEWSRELNIQPKTIFQRLSRGDSDERALRPLRRWS